MSAKFMTEQEFYAHIMRMEEAAPGFSKRHPLRGMFNLSGGGYQFGYEIGGYGTVVGHCVHHLHTTEEWAEECGARFFAGKRPRWFRGRKRGRP